MKRFVVKIVMRMLGGDVGEGYFDPNGALTDSIENARKFSAAELAKHLTTINWDATDRLEVESIFDET
jgi:hypothetical protein